jgi:presenilin-like A22 family membrane protease
MKDCTFQLLRFQILQHKKYCSKSEIKYIVNKSESVIAVKLSETYNFKLVLLVLQNSLTYSIFVTLTAFIDNVISFTLESQKRTMSCRYLIYHREP